MQVRLPGFTRDSLVELGSKVRDLYADGATSGQQVRSVVDDAYIGALADAVAGSLSGRTGVVPCVFLKDLVGDVMDRVDQFPDFDPRVHYALTVDDGELTAIERNVARGATSLDDIEFDTSPG